MVIEYAEKSETGTIVEQTSREHLKLCRYARKLAKDHFYFFVKIILYYWRSKPNVADTPIRDKSSQVSFLLKLMVWYGMYIIMVQSQYYVLFFD